jgi:hypothetical protein
MATLHTEYRKISYLSQAHTYAEYVRVCMCIVRSVCVISELVKLPVFNRTLMQ